MKIYIGQKKTRHEKNKPKKSSASVLHQERLQVKKYYQEQLFHSDRKANLSRHNNSKYVCTLIAKIQSTESKN